MQQEIHLHLDDAIGCHTTYIETLIAIYQQKSIVHTTIPHFLSWSYQCRLFVHCHNEVHEITLGECDGTERLIREGHNIEKMLFSGEFDWFQDHIGIADSYADQFKLMTKDAAYELIRTKPDVKLKHLIFDADKYIYSKNGCVYDECGYLIEDWHTDLHNELRSKEATVWNNGWYIV